MVRLRLSPLLLVATLVSCAGETPEGDPIVASVGQKWTAAPCGTVLASFDGTDAKSNGADTGTGNSCAGTGTYGLQYQCVELVMRHFKTHWKLRWYGNAKDLLTNAKDSTKYQTGSPADVSVYTNGDAAHPPVAGDMIVWTNGTYGHVALVVAVRKGYVDIIEQNVYGAATPGKYSLGWDGKTVAGRWSQPAPAGWAHAKANVGTVATDAGTDATPKDTGIDAPADAPRDTTSDGASDALDDASDADDATDDAPLDPEAGVGDRIVASDDAGAATEQTWQGGCSQSRSTDGRFALVILAVGAAAIARRRVTSRRVSAFGQSPR